jgi:hypothetical protein
MKGIQVLPWRRFVSCYRWDVDDDDISYYIVYNTVFLSREKKDMILL